MATTEIAGAIESIAHERDLQEFALGDTLDIKTGLILAALTFLAIQTGDLIKTSVTPLQVTLQAISILALVIGGALATAELWPRDYGREAPPDKYLDWVNGTDKYREDYPDAGLEPVTIQRLNEERAKVAVLNVQNNLALNRLKSTLTYSAFFCAVASFALNIATLAIRLF